MRVVLIRTTVEAQDCREVGKQHSPESFLEPVLWQEKVYLVQTEGPLAIDVCIRLKSILGK